MKKWIKLFAKLTSQSEIYILLVYLWFDMFYSLLWCQIISSPRFFINIDAAKCFHYEPPQLATVKWCNILYSIFDMTTNGDWKQHHKKKCQINFHTAINRDLNVSVGWNFVNEKQTTSYFHRKVAVPFSLA